MLESRSKSSHLGRRVAVAVIATTVQGVMPCERTAMGLALLAKLLSATFLMHSTSGSPGCFALRNTLGFSWGCTLLCLGFEVCTLLFFNHLSIASRSGNNVRVDSGTVE